MLHLLARLARLLPWLVSSDPALQRRAAYPRVRARPSPWLSGNGTGLNVPARCKHGNRPCLRSSTQSSHFWHWYMGELLPFVDWLSERPCLPRTVTIYRKDIRTPFASIYREIGESLGLAIYLVDEVKYETQRRKRNRTCRQLENANSHFQHIWQHCQTKTLWDNLRSWIPDAIFGAPWQLEIPECSNVFPPAFGARADGAPAATCENMYMFDHGHRIRCKDNLAERKEWTRRFLTVREWLLRWAGAKQGAGRGHRTTGKVEVLVQTRKTDAPMVKYFAAHKGYRSGSIVYGAAKRNVTNLHDVAAELERDARLNVQVASPDGLSLRQQIRAHRDVRVFIWGHGAGMVQMMWMRRGGLGIEISESHMNRASNVLVSPHHGGPLLAEGVGIERHDVWVASSHAAVNVSTIARLVEAWLHR